METSLAPTTELGNPDIRPIAPAWHTIAMVAVLLAFSWASAHATHHNESSRVKIAQYLFTMIWEYMLVAWVWWGVRMRGLKLRELIGGEWRKFEDVLMDAVVAMGFWLASMAVLGGLAYALKISGTSSHDQMRGLEELRRQIGFLVPRSALETWIWVGLSITAGFCEEIIFRGYLQRQLGAWARNAWVGIVLSGLVFGAGHGYEGVKRMMLIAVYGMMFGILAYWRKSLRPGMIAHAAHDGFTGLALRFLLK